ncbi:hypothetical protein GJ744_010931 [Endocarpon pusillum]|uniref:Alkaline ceramidase 3 n=1 Tax=Endocarpon pusillum TaxID=364733 RepID=A0A8H7E3U0_9EURO|nr:hypothetical protein GJ744_010931 [Endocarpon pusillum]
MSSWLPSLPYPPPDQQGFWEPVTSTINWCEEDYYATVYAAEIVNTLTNLLFIWLAYRGLVSCYKHGHDSVFAVAYAGYLAVGFGSLSFHATLKYPMQLVDELSMIYTTCLMAYASFSYSRSTAFRIVLAVSLVGLSLFITLYYHYLQDPAFHQNVYALLTTIIVFRTVFTMERTLRPSLRHSEEKHPQERKERSRGLHEKQVQARLNVRDKAILKDMWILVAFGLTMFLGGFGIWSLDNVYCSKLRSMRRKIGLPWGVLLEGHGWWHLMTGLGGYCYIVWGIWLRHCLNDRQDEYEFVWPRLYSLPEVVQFKAGKPSNNSLENGSAKKTR